MARRRNEILESQDKVDITPMIDVVFLLLIYFMVTVELIKEEADLGIQLPAPPDETETDEDPPTENWVEIYPTGEVALNGNIMELYTPSEREALPEGSYDDFTSTLVSLRQADARVGRETIVTIVADPDSLHQRSMDVLNACAVAEIELVSFGGGE